MHSGLDESPHTAPGPPFGAQVPLMVQVWPTWHGCEPLHGSFKRLRRTHVPSQLTVDPRSSPTHTVPISHSENRVALAAKLQVSPIVRSPDSTLEQAAGSSSASISQGIACRAARHALRSAAASKSMRALSTAGPHTAHGST